MRQTKRGSNIGYSIVQNEYYFFFNDIFLDFTLIEDRKIKFITAKIISTILYISFIIRHLFNLSQKELK